MPEQQVCYYAIHSNEAGEKRVRFGVSRRKEAQIETSLATWQKISALIAKNGCRLIKIKANGTARGGLPAAGSQPGTR